MYDFSAARALGGTQVQFPSQLMLPRPPTCHEADAAHQRTDV